MDWNRLVGPLLRMFLRTALNREIDHVARGGKTDAELSPEELKRAGATRKMAGRTRKLSRIAGRFLR